MHLVYTETSVQILYWDGPFITRESTQLCLGRFREEEELHNKVTELSSQKPKLQSLMIPLRKTYASSMMQTELAACFMYLGIYVYTYM